MTRICRDFDYDRFQSLLQSIIYAETTHFAKSLLLLILSIVNSSESVEGSTGEQSEINISLKRTVMGISIQKSVVLGTEIPRKKFFVEYRKFSNYSGVLSTGSCSGMSRAVLVLESQ